MNKYREVRTCAVCGKVMADNKFGDGIRIPKTTCLVCFKIAKERTEVKEIMNIKRIVKVTE
jgi:hypothetical protein